MKSARSQGIVGTFYAPWNAQRDLILGAGIAEE